MVLLDLRSGSYHLLNDVAALIWARLVSPNFDESALRDELGSRYGLAPERAATDIARFRAEQLQCGRLHITASCRDVTPRRGRLRRHILTFHAWRWLRRCERTLRRDGLASAWADAVALVPAQTQAGDPQRLARALRAFARAEFFHLSALAPNDCLPRSLALHAFLREAGLPVSHHFGFEHDLGHGHAWVEYEGRVLADSDRRADLAPFVA